jgi:hypothetical protein
MESATLRALRRRAQRWRSRVLHNREAGAEMAQSEEAAKLFEVFRAGKVDASVKFGDRFIEWTKGEGINSVDDFIGFVASDSYEEEWKTYCTFDSTLSRVLWARVKACWLVAGQAVKATQATPVAESLELEAPLPQSTTDSLQALWDAKYAVVLKIELRPADSLVGRIYRELRRRSATVIDIRKVKALIHTVRAETKQKVSLGKHVSVTFDNDEGEVLELGSIVDYYWGLRILANAYAFAGIEVVTSVADPTKTVLNSPLDVNLNYADDALRAASCLHVDPGTALSWLRERDVLTRGTMVSLMRQGWPQGEALREARREHSVDWYVKPHRERVEQPQRERQSSDQGKGSKQARSDDGASRPRVSLIRRPTTASSARR